MGLLNGIMGNASECSVEEVIKEYGKLLAEGEKIEKAYKLIRDLFIFTDKRLILVDKQGVTGKKVDHHSIPYKSITHFSIETAGHLDLDAELKIWISGSEFPIKKQFNKNLNIYELQSVLAKYILG
ncbi:PH domain-containing protein [Defluviitalea phaphyphila]|uniref:PH domain-containing protein n=1 Tax=Defluviitalea phaphyphila TaxID=1473580 RepID=UPI00073165EC|nr:PH domain-containing protein [Defluviitalea phaphyphila]